MILALHEYKDNKAGDTEDPYLVVHPNYCDE